MRRTHVIPDRLRTTQWQKDLPMPLHASHPHATGPSVHAGAERPFGRLRRCIHSIFVGFWGAHWPRTAAWGTAQMLALWVMAGSVLAQAPLGGAPVAPAVLQGTTVDGAPFSLAALKGRVVLVMFWSTGCAVCRDKMPELRQNALGWRGQPFDMVLVSTDRRQQDLMDYERIVASTVPASQRFTQLWTGAANYRDSLGGAALASTSLPTAYLLDKTGRVVERYSGRIPPEAWDRIADLL
jgi:thiol-disulfide isomerase/thioredoxin